MNDPFRVVLFAFLQSSTPKMKTQGMNEVPDTRSSMERFDVLKSLIFFFFERSNQFLRLSHEPQNI